MKTTIILHVILMTVAMNSNMRFSNGIPLDPDAEDKFFAEFNGLHDEAEENFTTFTPLDLSFRDDECSYLKKNILGGEYAGEETNSDFTIMCRTILDKSATDNHKSHRKVEGLCVTSIEYGNRTIGYRRSSRHSKHVYVFRLNLGWMNCNPLMDRKWVLMVIDLVKLPK